MNEFQQMPRAVSLFSGVGMFDLGVSLAGFDIVAQVEIDDYCRRVLKRHAPEYWPNATQFVDVREFGRSSIAGAIDLIYGGFPCQPHSLAGSRKGETDDRNLWPEFRRIISEIRPRAVMLENVPGITQAYTVEGKLRPAYALTIITNLAALGYVCRWGVISAADAGAPHQRDRWWCVAYAKSAGRKKPVKTGRRSHPAKVATRLDNRLKRRGYVVNAGGAGSPKPSSAERAKRARVRRKSKSASGARERLGAQSRLGGTVDGPVYRMDPARWPAYQRQPQYAWEAPRVVNKGLSPYRRQRLKALGNGGIWQIAYHLAAGIRTKIEGA